MDFRVHQLGETVTLRQNDAPQRQEDPVVPIREPLIPKSRCSRRQLSCPGDFLALIFTTLMQVSAVRGTVDLNLTFRSAADWTNLQAFGRAMPFGFAISAERTLHQETSLEDNLKQGSSQK